MSRDLKKAILVAGGTGGHINASLALGSELENKGYKCLYLSGKRYLDYQLYKDKNCQHLDVSPLRFKNPLKLFKGIFINVIAAVKLFKFFILEKPDFVIGAGGYVCGPTLLVAHLLRIPIFIIEQNAVMGLTNKLLGHISDKIFLHFKNTIGIKNKFQNKIFVTGNPTRSNIFNTSKIEETSNQNQLNLLVFGGSLGASQINEIIQKLLQKKFNFKLSIRHQIGKTQNTQDVLVDSSIEYVKYEYIENMNEFYQWSDVIVSRAGASTISELRVVGKPCALVPYPQATDNHQYFNASELKNENNFSVEVLDQKLNSETLANQVYEFLCRIHDGKGIIKAVEVNNINEDSSQMIIKEVEKYVWT